MAAPHTTDASSADQEALSRRRILQLAGIGGATLAAVGSGVALAAARSAPKTVAKAHPKETARTAVRAAPEVWLYLSVLTGKMDGKKGWPEFAPADFIVPANTLVHVEIRCFDDGAAPIPSGYERVRGTLGGTMELIHAVNGNVGAQKGTTVRFIDSKNVAHTLTFSDIGLNVPLPPLSTVRFAFHTPGRGHYGWQCMAACGTGTGGWGGPMEANGYMQGTMTVL